MFVLAVGGTAMYHASGPKRLVIAALVLAWIGALWLIWAANRRGGWLPFSRRAPRTLEAKLAALEQCGLRLAPPFTVGDLLKIADRSEYQKPGWDMVLVGLGMEEEQDPYRPYCRNLWDFDTECIEDHGDYARIARRMSDMAGESLPLEDIRDFVDIDGNQAWVSFKLGDRDIRIDCRVDDDWVDPDLFAKFDELLEQSDPSKLFIYYDLRGQDLVIGCVSKAQLNQLRALGVDFETDRELTAED